MAIAAIAYNTFLESIRKLELILLLLLGAFLVGIICYLSTDDQAMGLISRFMSNQQIVDLQSPNVLYEGNDAWVEHKMLAYMKSSAMFFNEILVMIIALSISLFLISSEITSGSILYILPKPVQRYQFILGKYFGAFAIIVACYFLMSLEVIVFFSLKEGFVDRLLIEALLLLPLKFGLFVGFMILFSTRLPGVIAGILTLLIYIGAHFSSRIEDLYEYFSGFFLYCLKLANFILPNLAPAFSGTIIDPDANLFENYSSIWGWIISIVIYNIILLILAVLAFRRKSL